MKLTRRQIAIMRADGPRIIESRVSESGEWAIYRGYNCPWSVTHVRSGMRIFGGTYTQCRRLAAALEKDGCGVLIVAKFPQPEMRHDGRAIQIVSQFRVKEGL